jgi:hypothetical protein
MGWQRESQTLTPLRWSQKFKNSRTCLALSLLEKPTQGMLRSIIISNTPRCAWLATRKPDFDTPVSIAELRFQKLKAFLDNGVKCPLMTLTLVR